MFAGQVSLPHLTATVFPTATALGAHCRCFTRRTDCCLSNGNHTSASLGSFVDLAELLLVISKNFFSLVVESMEATILIKMGKSVSVCVFIVPYLARYVTYCSQNAYCCFSSWFRSNGKTMLYIL